MSMRRVRNGVSSFFWFVTVVALIAVGAYTLLVATGNEEYIPPEVRDQLRPLATTATEFVTEPSKAAPKPRFGSLGEPPAPREAYPHIVPQPGDSSRIADTRFRFEGRPYHIRMKVPDSIYTGAVVADRRVSVKPGESDADSKRAFYRYLAQDLEQAVVIGKLCKQLRGIADDAGLDRDRYVEFLAKYVQSMPYDQGKLATDGATTRFPVETIVDGTGVCGDKSLLLATLLAHEGYEVALLEFAAEDHMAVGIRGPGAYYPKTRYLFIESTEPVYVSEIPDEFVGGVRLKSKPLAIPLGTGDAGYGAAEDVARIIRVRESAQPAAKKLHDETNGRVTAALADEINLRIEIANESQYRLRYVEGKESKYLDRVKANEWIADRVWWRY